MPEVAAREAYMASFHAAQACLFERDGRAPKTHSGVHAAFGLSGDMPNPSGDDARNPAAPA